MSLFRVQQRIRQNVMRKSVFQRVVGSRDTGFRLWENEEMGVSGGRKRVEEPREKFVLSSRGFRSSVDPIERLHDDCWVENGWVVLWEPK